MNETRGQRSEGLAFWGLVGGYGVFVALISTRFETLLWQAIGPVLTLAVFDNITIPAAMTAAALFLPLLVLAIAIKASGYQDGGRLWLAPLVAFTAAIGVLAIVGWASESNVEAYISSSVWLDGALGALAALIGVSAGSLALWVAGRDWRRVAAA